MKKVVLLGELGTKRDLNRHVAGREFEKTGAEVLHDSLARETVADAGLIVGIGSGKSRMVIHGEEYSSALVTEQWARRRLQGN